MKLTRKAKLIKAIDKVADILEKCGGPGGTPGPCPTGSNSQEKSRKAITYTDKAILKTQEASGHGTPLYIRAAKIQNFIIDNSHSTGAGGGLILSSKNHLKAAEMHLAVAKSHFDISKRRIQDPISSKLHFTAAESHGFAADLHQLASKD